MIFPQNYSHYSVLKSILKPAQIIDEIAALEYDGPKVAAITDLNSMAGIVQFYKAATDKNITPALGFTAQFMGGATVVLLAKNKNGYKNLLKILASVNTKDNFFRHPQLSFELLKKLDTSDIVCLIGHVGSALFKQIHTHGDDEVNEDWMQNCMGHLDLLLARFDKDDVYLQIESTISEETKSCYREIIKKYKIKHIFSNQIHYGSGDKQKKIYDILRATKDKCQIKYLSKIQHVLNPQLNEENDYSRELESKIEKYDILGPQVLPVFKTPSGESSLEYLTELCREGFRKKLTDRKNPIYTARIKEELDIFRKANLADYFLILQDVVKWSESQGYKTGPGRGSAAGCLISYLIGITKIDPIKHGLLFSRFFNAGRIGSMPDIDVDFPKAIRDRAIEYTMNKYTRKHCGQIATFQTFMGRAALKAVFRSEGELSFSDMNEITSCIEDKAKISDELEQMSKAGIQPSVILWSLKNRSHKLEEYVNLEDDENIKLSGPLAEDFEYAIALEGIKSAQSKHAAGLVISKDTLESSCPTLYDEGSEEQMIGIEYEDAESLGMTKYDFLSLSSLDRLADINKTE